MENCDAPVVGGGFCRKHYMRLKRKGSTGDTRKNARKACSVTECDRSVAANGMCDMHYRRQRRYGHTDLPVSPAPPPPTRGPERLCFHCGKPMSPDLHALRKYHPECNEAAAFHKRQTEHRSRWLKRYGITPEAFDRILAGQGGRCVICQTAEPGSRGWCVDHCHETGRVRGLLCVSCNSALGQFKDDPALLRRAIEYLGG